MGRKQRVINHSLQPQMLESGQQLAAAGTAGSVREDVAVSDADRARLGALITVVEVEPPAAPEGDESPQEHRRARPKS